MYFGTKYQPPIQISRAAATFHEHKNTHTHNIRRTFGQPYDINVCVIPSFEIIVIVIELLVVVLYVNREKGGGGGGGAIYVIDSCVCVRACVCISRADCVVCAS